MKKIISTSLRGLVQQNPILYKLWFYNNRKLSNRIRLPQKSDEFYFDGYPRSGNTYAKALISYIYPEKRFAHHLHCVAPLKIALNKDVPPIIIFRKPEDAIVSNLFTKIENSYLSNLIKDQNELISALISDYARYYKYVNKYKAKIKLIKFEDFITNKKNLINLINKYTKGKEYSDKHLDEFIKEFDAYFKEKENNKKDHSSSLPNETRKKFKNEIKNKIYTFKELDRCNDLYSQLSKTYQKQIESSSN